MISTIDDVIARMREIGDSVGPGDGVGEFNAVYQRTTEAIRDRLIEGFFDDASFTEHFDVVLANRSATSAMASDPLDHGTSRRRR